jgi:gamma-glutamyl-gamma-aminobutyrate hydrolase PuuD
VKFAHFQQKKNRWAHATLADTYRRSTKAKQNIALRFSLSYFPMLALCRNMTRILLVALAGALFKNFGNLPDKFVHGSKKNHNQQKKLN